MLSRDRCLFLRSSLDRIACPSVCSRSVNACCSLSSDSSRSVSGIKDVRSSAAVLAHNILQHHHKHQSSSTAEPCMRELDLMAYNDGWLPTLDT